MTVTSDPIRGELVPSEPATTARTARAAFLARYDNPHTRAAYTRTIDRFYTWCDNLALDPMRAERAHLELFARWLEQEGLARSSVAAALNALAGLYLVGCAENDA